jgi:hypothetical protein
VELAVESASAADDLAVIRRYFGRSREISQQELDLLTPSERAELAEMARQGLLAGSF